MRTFIRSTVLLAIFGAGVPAVAQHDEHDHHSAEHHSGAHDHQSEHKQLEADHHGEHDQPATASTLTMTPEIKAALAEGGSPVVADVLGVVCDFCATAMNKIFGARDEVAAVYVDLDTKALNLVIKSGHDLDDPTIAELAVQAGYRIAAVHREPLIQES